MDINIATARDGNEILEVSVNGKEYKLNSTYRPISEAEKFAEQFSSLEQGSVLFVFGFGNGIFPEALAKQCGDRVQLVFYEPGQEIMEIVQKRYAIAEFCRRSQSYLVSPVKVEDKSEYLYEMKDFSVLLDKVIQYHNRKKIQYCVLPKYKELFSVEYNHVEEQIRYRVHSYQSNIYTAKVLGHIAVKNNVENLQYLPDSFCGDSFCTVFPKELPAIIVSAGPSLEKNVHLLKTVKGRAIVFCVDTALKYLLKQEIIPDFLVSVDPRKSLSLFEDERAEGIPIIGSSDMSTKVLEKMKRSKHIFVTSENTYIQKQYQKAKHQISRLESGGSVATVAYSVCRYWGFERVILVGQDLALSDNQMYAGAEKISMDTFGRKLIEVEGIDGGTVYTTQDYYFYLKWFEQMCERYPEAELIDATEGGARIKGTKIMTLEQAIVKYAKEEYDIEKIIGRVQPAFGEKEKEEIIKAVQQSKKKLKTLEEKLTEAIRLSDEGIKLAEIKSEETEKRYQIIKKQIEQICDLYDTMEESFFIEREIDATDLENYMALFEEQDKLTRQERYRRLKLYFQQILQATKTVRELFG